MQNEQWKTIKLPLKFKSSTRAIALRVKEVITQAYYRPGKEYWLIIENYALDQYKYYVSNAPLKTPLKKLILWAHERWKIEQGYQQLKEEPGLDHLEGRSWRGLHHHITLCFMAYAFLLLLKQTYLKKNGGVISLPQVRRWLNALFAIVNCPYCKKHYSFLPYRTFFNTC